MVQSRLLSAKILSIATESATTAGNNSLPSRYVGGMMESLNRKATDSTTTRFVPVCSIALFSAVANCSRRCASALEIGRRGPNEEMMARAELSEGARYFLDAYRRRSVSHARKREAVDTRTIRKLARRHSRRVTVGQRSLAGTTGLEPAASAVTGQQRRATYWISTVLTARS